MAKESMKAREVKRAKLVAKYAEKRAALKKIVNTGDPVEAFEAAQKLQAIPKTANPIRLHNRCKLTGTKDTQYIQQAYDMLGLHMILIGVTAVLVVLLPVYRKLLRKINTSIAVEYGDDMAEIEINE